MALARCNLVLQDEDGNVVDGASVTVAREEPGFPLASVYSDRDGAVPLGNPYVAADGADAGFHAEAGEYKITAVLGGFTREIRYFVIPAASGGAGGQLPDADVEGYVLLTHGPSSDPTYEGFTQSGTGAAIRTYQTKLRDTVSVKDFGAACDGTYIDGAVSITASTVALTCSAAAFSANDVGKCIVIPGAGAAGVPLSTTIATFVGLTQVTLDDAASTTLSAVSKFVFYGTDDAEAIQDAIDSLPVTGGLITIPGVCAIASALVVGDGGGSPVISSSRWGVRLVGTTMPIFPYGVLHNDPLYPRTYQCGLVYAGPRDLALTMLKFAGPLRGFEVSNLLFDGMEQCQHGLYLYATSFGCIDFLAFTGQLGAGLVTAAPSTTVFVGDGNTSHITSRALYFRPPPFTNATGAYFDGATDVTCDTHSVIIDLFRVHHPGVQDFPAAGAATYGVIFRSCDTITINNMLQVANPVNGNCKAVFFDYAPGTAPADIILHQIDVGFGISAANQFLYSGSPTAGLPLRNHIIGYLGETNGGVYPKTMPITLVDLPVKQCVDIDIINHGAAIGATALHTLYKQGMWRISYAIEITQAGAGGTIDLQIGWTSPAGGSPGSVRGFAAPTLNATLTASHTEGVLPIMCFGSAGVPTNISYVVNFTGTSGSPLYNLFLRLEKMD